MKNIGIIGGGVIGLSTAYYLSLAGHKVTVLDVAEVPRNCSLGNAGMIVPSHIIPLAAPGMISKGIRWMFDSASPFYVKPRLRMDLIRWGLLFYRNANHSKVVSSARALKELSLYSRQLYQTWSSALADFGFHQRGLLMLYQRAETEREEAESADLANQLGVQAQVLNPQQVQALEPDVRVQVRGGIYFPGDAHLTPHVLVDVLKRKLIDAGVLFYSGARVNEIKVEKRMIRALRSDRDEFHFDEVVLAAGSWSEELGRLFGLTLPVQAGKGYSFNLTNVQKNVRIPSILLEPRVAVTPMGADLRFGGTMEIGGINHEVNMRRVQGIVNAIPQFYPDMRVAMPEKRDVWHGLRPCSPDGLPYIGRSSKVNNLLIATGHGMMGLSLAPATGKIIADCLDETKPSINISPFNPERFD